MNEVDVCLIKVLLSTTFYVLLDMFVNVIEDYIQVSLDTWMLDVTDG